MHRCCVYYHEITDSSHQRLHALWHQKKGKQKRYFKCNILQVSELENWEDFIARGALPRKWLFKYCPLWLSGFDDAGFSDCTMSRGNRFMRWDIMLSGIILAGDAWKGRKYKLRWGEKRRDGEQKHLGHERSAATAARPNKASPVFQFVRVVSAPSRWNYLSAVSFNSSPITLTNPFGVSSAVTSSKSIVYKSHLFTFSKGLQRNQHFAKMCSAFLVLAVGGKTKAAAAFITGRK